MQRRLSRGVDLERATAWRKRNAGTASLRGRSRVSALRAPYRFTSFRSFAGSPDGLFVSAVQLPPAVNTRELLEMLHWSTVASASMLPWAVATKLGVGGATTPAAVLQAVAAYVWLKVLPYLNVSTWMPVSVVAWAMVELVRSSRRSEERRVG